MDISWSFIGILALAHYLLALSVTTAAVDAFGGNETDRLALLEFKAQIRDDPFGALSSWNASTHFCNRRQRVTVLDLSNSKLAGSISPHMGNLSFLKKVNLENNSFTHHIPRELGNLRRLRRLVLNNNLMQGTIPANISTCSHLNVFAADSNHLVGDIPMGLGSLSNLLYLSLESNNLSGNIPSSFANLSSLRRFYADNNNLNGSIPNDLSFLTNLTMISLGRNRLSGTVPPSIFNLSFITELDLHSNQIHETLPSNLFNTLPNLQFLSIVDNQFTGPIPISLSNASNLAFIQLGDNKLQGKVPSFEKMHMVKSIVLINNALGTRGVQGDLLFVCSLTNATSLFRLALSGNNFGGALPECITNLSTTVTNLLLDNNKIFGGIPNGIGNLVNLQRLYMWNNQFSGHIPLEIGNLEKMQEMALNGNMPSGQIPSSIGNLRILSKLYLYDNNFQGSIPSNLSRCQNLIILNLENNHLGRGIPLDVLGITSLSIVLSLAGNQLSGSIPVEVANLINLGFLDLSDNLLSGEIPAALSNCLRLEGLVLGGNFFQGDIPPSFSSLRGITGLNFSHNNLSGELPKFLESLASLQILDLSYNNFKGMVPVEGVFKNARTILVKGNNELCGGIQELQLPKCPSTESKKNKSTLMLILVLTFVSMLVVAMLLLFVVLYCCPKKRTIPMATPSTKSLVMVSYQDLLQGTKKFSSANMIGKGGFGSVYKGALQQIETVVAVKVINLFYPGALKSFEAECEVLKNIRHRNLVKVITACSGIDHNGNDFKALVYEFMANGSLDEWLHQVHGKTNRNEEPRKLSFLERMNIAIDVASALDYLHHGHQESPIVHCDLKPSNVLLDAEMIGHVGDFGLARFLQDVRDVEMSSIAIKGSIGYTEYGMGSGLSTEGDVYSYGILLLEVFTGKRPTDDMFQDGLNLRSFVKEALPYRVMEISDPVLLGDVEDEREPIIVECLVLIFGVGVACCAESPRERPSISYALSQLGSQRDKFLAA